MCLYVCYVEINNAYLLTYFVEWEMLVHCTASFN